MSDYHLGELKVALNPNNPDHLLPPQLPQSAKVLDVGCGAGQSLIAAYPDRVSFGIDVDFEALSLGTTLTKSACLVNGKAEALPFQSGYFDFVFARVSLPYTNIPNAIPEIRRVLKKGGEVWLALHPFSIPWEQVKKSNYKGKIWFVNILLNSLLLHLVQKQYALLGRYETFQTERGIRRALLKNGFENIRITRGKHFLVTARAS